MYKKYLEFKDIYKLGQASFYLGAFFLSSALPISLIFFLVSTIISFYLNKFEIFKEKSSYIFFKDFYFFSLNYCKILERFLEMKFG